jgi:hypothetical protein
MKNALQMHVFDKFIFSGFMVNVYSIVLITVITGQTCSFEQYTELNCAQLIFCFLRKIVWGIFCIIYPQQ